MGPRVGHVIHVNMAFIQGQLGKMMEFFRFMAISVMPQNLESWQLYHNIFELYG
jgi:hypothetical protein